MDVVMGVDAHKSGWLLGDMPPLRQAGPGLCRRRAFPYSAPPGLGLILGGTSTDVDHDLAGVVLPPTGWPRAIMPIR